MGIRIPKAPTPGTGQGEFNLFPEDSLPLKECFAHVPTPERGLQRTVAGELAGRHIWKLLNGIASGKNAVSPEQMDKAWDTLGKLDKMTALEVAKALEDLQLTPDKHPVGTRTGYTRTSIQRALNRVQEDTPAEILQKLKPPSSYSRKDITELVDYAVAQRLTTHAEIKEKWRMIKPSATIGTDGRMEETPYRVYAAFVATSELKRWQESAQKRWAAAPQPQPLQQSKPNADSVSADRQPSEKSQRKSTLF